MNLVLKKLVNSNECKYNNVLCVVVAVVGIAFSQLRAKQVIMYLFIFVSHFNHLRVFKFLTFCLNKRLLSPTMLRHSVTRSF